MVQEFRVALISRWNATCGISLHAEMIGREFIKRGYPLKVFAPTLESAGKWWHHIKIREEDEEYVERVYEEIDPEGKGGSFKREAVLDFKPDLIILESYQSLPHKDIEELIKEVGVPAFAVLHEGDFLRYSDLSIFERIAVFDGRFTEELIGDRYPREKVVEIPYPCYPLREQNRRFAEDGIIRFVTFGRQPAFELEPFVKALRELRKVYENIRYKIVRGDKLIDVSEEWIEQELKVLDLEDIDLLLKSSDIHLLPKGPTNNVVVSSTLYQIMGTLCITVVPNTRHFEMHKEDNTVVIYEGVEDLIKKLREIIENEELRRTIKESMRRYVEENSVERIVDRFEELIDSVLVKNVK